MLKEYSIHGFKSFNQVCVHLSNLNLFAGANSAGKSTAIQALLLAADNLEKEPGDRIMNFLHTPPLSFNEARNYLINAKEYSVQLRSDDQVAISMRFSAADDAFWRTGIHQEGVPSERFYALLCNNLLYLPATRTWQLNNSSINPNVEKNPLGTQGEYIIDYYYNHHEDLMPEELTFFPSVRTLEAQVNYWLQRLTGYRLTVEPDVSRYKVKFVTQDGKELHPYHVGTGISFIAELVITCLSCRSNGMVIIENPEAHLHRLLHKNEIGLEDVSVYNFIRTQQGLTEGKNIALSQQGGIRDYEPGMFEQFDKDLDEILS